MTDHPNAILEEDSSSPDGEDIEGTSSNSASLTIARRSETSTRASLLVAALIKFVLTTHENDPKRQSITYKQICRRLYKMGLIDESWSMAELEGARIQFEHTLNRLFNDSPISRPNSPFLLFSDYYIISQYKREFDEIEPIGFGGFGKVFRVKNKLDGTEYAVKKVPISSERIDSVKTYISEVKTFAALNHPNIVQYKAAWLELGLPSDIDAIMNPSWDQQKVVTHSEELGILDADVWKRDDSSFVVEFQDSSNQANEESSSSSDASSVAKRAIIRKAKNGTIRNVHWATLYIQMALCQGTLELWLTRRNESFNAKVALMPSNAHSLRTNAIRQILIQILRGLEYIHSKKIVHHDIKPSNIFVTVERDSLLVQLGDFGLACHLHRTKHSLSGGTPLYAAPEQIKGHCNPKSDIYSVGIILFELQEDFGTNMERSKKIMQLRKSNPPIPPDLTLGNLVSALVRQRAEERPDTRTLLQALEGPENVPKSYIEVFEEQLKQKDEEIQRLRELLKQNGVEDV